MLEFYADPMSAYHQSPFDPSRRTILYCASGGRSALAADMLRLLGYTRVAHLDGGLKAWREVGPTTPATRDPELCCHHSDGIRLDSREHTLVEPVCEQID